MRHIPHILTSIALAAMLLLVATAPGATAEPAPIVQEIKQPTETGELITATLIILAIVNIALVGYVIYDALSDKTPAQGADETGRQLEADIVIEMLDINGQLLTHNLNGFADVWRFTNTYWMRQAEVAAAERWGAGKQYDPQALTERAGIYHNSAKLLNRL